LVDNGGGGGGGGGSELFFDPRTAKLLKTHKNTVSGERHFLDLDPAMQALMEYVLEGRNAIRNKYRFFSTLCQ